MSKICLLTKKKSIKINSVSNSNIKKKIKKVPNFQNFKIWHIKRFKKIKITTRAYKIIKKCIF